MFGLFAEPTIIPITRSQKYLTTPSRGHTPALSRKLHRCWNLSCTSSIRYCSMTNPSLPNKGIKHQRYTDGSGMNTATRAATAFNSQKHLRMLAVLSTHTSHKESAKFLRCIDPARSTKHRRADQTSRVRYCNNSISLGIYRSNCELGGGEVPTGKVACLKT